MKSYDRMKDSVKSGIYILLGLVAVYFISTYLQTFNIDYETTGVSKEIEEHIPTNNDIEIKLDIDKIYEYGNQALNEENITQLLRYYVPGGVYLSRVSWQEENQMNKVMITYIVDENVPLINKSRKDQIALLSASILMSLYPQIDTIKVSMVVESELYERVLYRPDIENYFGISIDCRDEKNTFERIANEFVDASNVSQYNNMKHPYDSLLGEDVERFYKMNFPVIEEGEIFPYIDEEVEQELVAEYGYKLFLQGLWYENTLMNYYSAYRLSEYYGTAYSEQIILELATCAAKTKDERVLRACEKVIDLLVPLKEGIRVFDRFNESTLEGGHKIYTISEKGLVTLAKWQGEENAGLKIVSISPNEDYVLCEAVTPNNRYRYILSCQEEGSYILSEKGAFKDGMQSAGEIMSQVSSVLKKQSMEQEMKMKGIQWGREGLVYIDMEDEIELVYDISTNKVQMKKQYIENFGENELETYLKQVFETVTKTSISGSKVKKYIVDGEVLMVYVYDSMVQKNAELSKNEGQAQENLGKMWSRGKVSIYYNGTRQEVIKKLNQLIL